MRAKRNPLLKYPATEEDEYQTPGMIKALKPAAQKPHIPNSRTSHWLTDTNSPNSLLSELFTELTELTELDNNPPHQPKHTEHELPEWFTSIDQQPRDKPKITRKQLQEQLNALNKEFTDDANKIRQTELDNNPPHQPKHTEHELPKSFTSISQQPLNTPQSTTKQLQEQLNDLNNEFTVDANKIRQEEELAFQRLQRLQLEEQHSKQAAKIYEKEEKSFQKIQKEFQGYELTEPQKNIMNLDSIVINYIITKLQKNNQAEYADKIQGFLNKLNYQRRYDVSSLQADIFRDHTILHLAQKADSYLNYDMREIFDIIVSNIQDLPKINEYLKIQCLCSKPGGLKHAAKTYDYTHRDTDSNRATILQTLRKPSRSQKTSLPTISVRHQPINPRTEQPPVAEIPLIAPKVRRRLRTPYNK